MGGQSKRGLAFLNGGHPKPLGRFHSRFRIYGSEPPLAPNLTTFPSLHFNRLERIKTVALFSYIKFSLNTITSW